MDEKLAYYYSRIGRSEKAAFFSVLIFGLITHIHIFSVNYVSRDAVNIDNLGATYSSGRWLLGFMYDVSSRLLGTYQLPFINGFISILFIGLAVVLIINALEIKTQFLAVLLGATIVSFPSVASHFAFMFTTPAYFLSLLFSTLSIYCFHKRPSIYSFILGVLLLCMSMGIYQAYLCFSISFALAIFLNHGLRHKVSFSKLFGRGFQFVTIISLGLILYFLVNKLVLSIKGYGMTNYQGLDKMGQISLSIISQAVSRAYSDQLMPSWPGIITSFFEMNLTRLVIVISVFLFLRIVWGSENGISVKVLLFIALLVCPLAFNSIHIMVPETVPGVHSLMRMSLIFTFVLPLTYCDILSATHKSGQKRQFNSVLLSCCIFVLSLLPVTYCYRDNTAYLNAELAEEQAEAYFGSMITRIRSTNGYRDELPLAYVNPCISDSTLTQLSMKDNVHTFILSLSVQDVLNENNWREFCALHLGWSPSEVEDISYYQQLEEVQQMPCYPDDGSIQIIEGAVVVKFSETK